MPHSSTSHGDCAMGWPDGGWAGRHRTYGRPGAGARRAYPPLKYQDTVWALGLEYRLGVSQQVLNSFHSRSPCQTHLTFRSAAVPTRRKQFFLFTAFLAMLT